MKITNVMGPVALAASLMGSAAFADVLKFAHVYEVGHPLQAAAEKAAELFEERTEGRHSIEVFPASSLGKETDLNEGLSLGTVDIIYTGAGFAGSFYGPASMTDFPFTLRNLDHWKAYFGSDVFAEVARGYADATGGNEIAAVSYYGSRPATANKPILTPEDMQDLKIRVPGAPAYMLFPAAVGANPTPLAFAEVYLALQQGVVDAQENPLTTIKAKRFHEVQSDISLTGHIINSTYTVVSGFRLGMLSDEDRQILDEVLKETADDATAAIVQAETELADWFRGEGVTVNEVDRAPFIAAVAPALTNGDQPFPTELYERLQAVPDAE